MEPVILTPPRTSPLITPHHSRSDWRYWGPNWPSYDLVNFITPPSSLATIGGLGENYRGWTMLKTWECLPEIQIVSNVYFEFSASEIHQHYFRAQADPPPPYYQPANCYYLRFWPACVWIFRNISQFSVDIATASFSPPLSLNKWYKWRFCIWDFPSHANPTQLVYKFDLWETDHWTTYLSGTTSPSYWSHSTKNMYGIWLMNRGSYVPEGVKIDDTVILIPAP